MISKKPFAHSQFDFKLLCFYPFYIQVISLTTVKMVHGLARAMERATNLSIIFS